MTMKHSLWTISTVQRLLVGSAVAGVLFSPVAAHADPNMPRRARGVVADLVRAYAACQPNEATSVVADTAACAPLTPLSDFTFGPNGQGTVAVRRMSNGLLQFHVALRGVRDPSGKPVDQQDLTLRFAYRVSTDLCVKDTPCTATDIVNQFPPIPCVRGRCTVSFNNAVLVGEILMPSVISNLEILQLAVLDPTGNVFAVPGVSTGR